MLIRARALIASWPCLTKGERAGFALNSPAGLCGQFCPPKTAIASTLLKAWGEKE